MSNNAAVVEINTPADLKSVLAGSTNVIIDFWAQWCGPCRVISASLDKLEAELVSRNVVVAKVNVDLHGSIAESYGVRSLPTLVYIDATGNVLTTKFGATDPLKLKADIVSAFPNVTPAANASAASAAPAE